MQRIFIFYQKLFTDNLHWFKIVLNWFILAFIAGVITFFINPDFLQTILASYADRFGANPALDINLAIQIFIQNFTVSLLAIFGGLILGLGPLVVVVVNAFLIGFVVASLFFLSSDLILSLGAFFGGILPHGIIELPTFLVAAALGLRLGISWLQKSSEGNRKIVLKRSLVYSLIILPGIALALFIAALIEVFVSGKIVDGL